MKLLKYCMIPVMTLVSFSSFAENSFRISVPDHVYQVHVGNENPYGKQPQQQDLTKRIYELERAVSQLQNALFQLSTRPAAAPVNKPLISCSLNAFGQRYSGTGETANLARQRAADACAAQNNAMFCKPEKANCS